MLAYVIEEENKEGRRTVKPVKIKFTSLLILLRATIAALILEHDVFSFIIDTFYL